MEPRGRGVRPWARGLPWSAVLAAVLAAVLPGRAAANEFDDFQNARSAYDAGSYELAANLFGDLVGGDVPRLQNQSLILESLKYLAASELFVDRSGRAESAFERLLRRDIDYVLDPVAFPAEVHTVFDRVKRRLLAQLAESRAAEEAAAKERAQAGQSRLAAERARLARLVALAETEQVEERRSRLVAAIPFGVGQFQNGDDGLGLLLAVTEGALLSVGVVSFLLHDDLRGQTPAPSELASARATEQALRLTNQISMGLLAVVAITGIVDAQLRFKPSRVRERRRELDPELRRPFDLSITPSGMQLRF